MANALRSLLVLLLFTACDPENLGEIHVETDAESDEYGPYPRKVIVNTTFDFGFSTRLADGARQKVFAEDAVLIEMVKAGINVSDIDAFGERVIELGGYTDPNYPWLDLAIHIAHGPYIILSRGGNENLMERDGVDWW